MGSYPSKPAPAPPRTWFEWLRGVPDPAPRSTWGGTSVAVVNAVLVISFLYYIFHTVKKNDKKQITQGEKKRDLITTAKHMDLEKLKLYPEIDDDIRELINVVADSLKQLDGDIIVSNSHKRSKNTPKTIRRETTTNTQRRKQLDQINPSSIDDLAPKKRATVSSPSLASRKSDKKKNKNVDLRISAPIPSAHTSFATNTDRKAAGTVSTSGSICSLDMNDIPEPYVTSIPKLTLQTHSHNTRKRIEDVKMSQEKKTQFISELICGKHYGKAIGNISKWERHIEVLWSNNNKDIFAALVDWSFEEEDGEWNPISGKGATGTSWRRVLNTDASTNIMNLYHTHVAKKHSIIRSGIIDTQKKADQFKAVVAKVAAERRDMNLDDRVLTRVCSVSLVSTCSLAGDEKEMAKQQHATLLSTLGKNRYTPTKATKSNSVSSPSTGRQRLGSMSSVSSDSIRVSSSNNGFDFIHMNYQTNVNEIQGVSLGEKSSRRLNNAALVTYCRWALEDAKNVCTLYSDITGILPVHELVQISFSEITGEEVTKAIVKRMHTVSETFDEFFMTYLLECDTSTKKEIQTRKYALAKVNVALKTIHQLCLAHVNEGGMSRVSELILIALINISLNVLQCVNCKSGCDRTGLMFAIATSVAMMWESRRSERLEFLDMCLSFDEISQEHQEVYSKGIDAWASYVSNQERSLAMNQLSLLCCEFRNVIFLNLMEVGWRCILYSTGLPGFKVGSDTSMLKNPHVTPLLPPFISSPNGIKCNSDFRDFFIGASDYRGGNPASS